MNDFGDKNVKHLQSELGSNILQSPKDEDATFRTKWKRTYRGPSGNIIETTNSENEMRSCS